MTTAFEAWHVPAWSGLALEEEFTWSSVGDNAQAIVSGEWRTTAGNGGIIGEIKPHTARGIADGWRQLHHRLLLDRRARTPTALGRLSPDDLKRGVLVTYRKVGPETVQVRAAFASNQHGWVRVGQGRFEWARPVPLESCPSCLGSQIEPLVRDIVQRQTTLRIRPKSGAQSRGADLIMSLELSEFLAEVNAELRAELAELTNELNELACR